MGKVLDPSQYEVVGPAPAPALGGGRVLDPERFEVLGEVAAPGASGSKPSALQAAGLGAFQGVTFGFGDEAAAGIRALVDSKDIRNVPAAYRKNRDEERAKFHEAQEAHPWAYGAAQVGGGVLTAPLSLPVRGAGLAANAARAGFSGILAGAGSSEADTIEGVAADAAKGGLVAAGTGALLGAASQRFTRGAQGRVDKRLFNDIGTKATKRTRDKMFEREGDIIETASKRGWNDIARDPEALKEAATTAKVETGKSIGDLYARVDEATPGIPLAKVMRALHKVEQEYNANPSLGAQAAGERVAKQIEVLREKWKGLPAVRGVPQVPAAEVNAFKSSLQEGAFRTADIAPKIAVRAERAAARAVKDVLEEHVGDVMPDALPQLRALNREFGSLAEITKAASERTRLAAFSPTGLRDIAGKSVDALALMSSIGSGNPLPYIASKWGIPLGGAVVRKTDVLAAQLVAAAQKGSIPAKLAQKAIEEGIPRGFVEELSAATVQPEQQTR